MVMTPFPSILIEQVKDLWEKFAFYICPGHGNMVEQKYDYVCTLWRRENLLF